MVRLLVLDVALAFWRTTLDISKKLSGRTWVTLAIISATIAFVAFSTYSAKSVPDSAIPPVYFVDTSTVPAPHPYDFEVVSLSACATGMAQPTEDPVAIIRHSRYWEGPLLFERNPNDVSGVEWNARPLVYNTGRGFNVSVILIGAHFHHEAFNRTNRSTPALALNDFSDWLPKVPVPLDRFAIQLPNNDAPSILTPVQQMVAILVGIFTTFFAALSTFFSWQVYRKARAQEILTQLQIAKLQAEIDEYKAKARKEQEKSGIIIVT